MADKGRNKAGGGGSIAPRAWKELTRAANSRVFFAQADRVLRTVRDKDVRFVRIWFVDILGQLKSFTITARELESAFREGMGVDGSSIEGFARIEESDLVAVPDPFTFVMLPWKPGEPAMGSMTCDILNPDGKPYAGDTRHVLKRNAAEAAEKGYVLQVGPELEYFYFKNDRSPEPIDRGGYFDTVPLDEAQDLRRETILLLEGMGIPIEYSHHEVAPSQHEIDLRHAEALTMADTVMHYKVVVKQVADSHGIYASFMPKPIAGVNGSGMHVHMSLFKGDRNAFFDPKDPVHLSKTARQYLAGVLKYSSEICAVTNQWVNSYKRLVPGYEAPVYVSWGRRNRSTLVRVPMTKPGKEKATRIEARFPDPACNPYLAFSVLLAAGLQGIKENLDPPAPVEEDIYAMTVSERRARGVKDLPGSLMEALDLARGSQLLKKALGEHVFTKFIENKTIEWDRFRSAVTSYEIEQYLPIL